VGNAFLGFSPAFYAITDGDDDDDQGEEAPPDIAEKVVYRFPVISENVTHGA